MTYDPDRRQVVIFGGEAPGDLLVADTWGWDGSAWHCITPGGENGPRPRGAAMLAYDERRQVLVLYGGRVGREGLRDTWELNQAGWSRKDSAGPTAEPHGVMAWDEAAGAVLLYHSLGDDGPLRATWLWDGRTWSKVAEGPNEEFPDAMLSSQGGDPALLVTAKPSPVPDAFTAPLYRWQQARWVPISASGAVPTFSPQAPAARTATGVLLFTGFEPNGSVTTSVLEGTTWRTYAGGSPPRRKGTQMVLDPGRGVVVLHAGDDGRQVLGDTWEWNGREWHQVRCSERPARNLR